MDMASKMRIRLTTERDYWGRERGKLCPFTSVEGKRFMKLAEDREEGH